MNKLQGDEGVRGATPVEHADPNWEPEAVAYRRDRLLAALTLIAGAGLTIALPFALRAGA
jgi:hypothetical protein